MNSSLLMFINSILCHLNGTFSFRKKKKKTGENPQDLWLSEEFIDLT